MATAVLAVHDEVTTLSSETQKIQHQLMPQTISLRIKGVSREFNILDIIGLFRSGNTSTKDANRDNSISRHLYSCRVVESQGLKIRDAFQLFPKSWSKTIQKLFGISADAVGELSSLYHSDGGPNKVHERLRRYWAQKEQSSQLN